MSLLDLLGRTETWEAFAAYKASRACPKQDAAALRAFIDERRMDPVLARIARGEPFPLPRRSEISKLHSGKKRIVYTYPPAENTVLKCLTWLLLRKYDGLFSPGLYSFRPGRTAKDAVRALNALPEPKRRFGYKADVSNYFNSVDLDRFLPLLEAALADDPALYGFLRGLLTEPHVLSGGRPVAEQKGIMAGTPLACFYANLFLNDVDRHFSELGIPYARYSDDIILFAPTQAETEEAAALLGACLAEKGLEINPEKACFFAPEEGWMFLGFFSRHGTVDIAPATLAKLKAKMRRKTRALARWRDRTGRSGEDAARAFLRVFNRKLFEAPTDNELSWSRWFFPVINTTETLAVLDRYAQDCLRTLISGKRTKARFNVRYEDLKVLGYQSLVHAYYAHLAEEKHRGRED